MATVNFRGVTLDSRTARMMDVVALRTRPKIIPTQGSFSTSVTASAGTHSGAGAIDLSVRGLDAPHVNAIVKVMRQVGFAAWHRLVSEGPWPVHIHGIAVNAPGLSTSAAKQVAALRRGRNGLANDGLDRHRNMNLPVIAFEKFLTDTNTGAIVDLSDLQAQVRNTGRITGIVGRAMAAMNLPATRDGYKRVQQILGFTGADADGIPDKTSLSRLGDAFGFRIELAVPLTEREIEQVAIRSAEMVWNRFKLRTGPDGQTLVTLRDALEEIYKKKVTKA
jgi:hypothetical protein